MLTPDQLRRIMPNLPAAKADALLPHLNAAMSEFGIDTLLRTAAFAAQLAHESGEFRWMEEIWGPTSAQKRYEPLSDLSQRLGNTEAGDGLRFKGRGPIQLTGRANYARFGGLLGLDLVGSPAQAAAPEVAFRIAALFWKNRGLNELAEAGDFREVTRRINGGFNGLEDRLKYYERAKSVLASGFDAGAAPATRAAVRAKVSVPLEPLMRGAEAIQELLPARKRRTPPAKTAGAGAGVGRPETRKVAAKKGAARKASVGKAAAGQPAAKKAAAKKAAAKKTVAKKTAAKKAVVKKTAAGKMATKRAVPAKAAPGKRIAAKAAAKKAKAPTRAPARKAATRKATSPKTTAPRGR
jgi:putative chitinase